MAASDRVLSQDEIDGVFLRSTEEKVKVEDDDPSKRALPYDFRRPDRIAKDQLRSIHLLHENFARSRAYVMVSLVSVEQLSFLEFSQCLPSPSCIIAMGMRPYDGNGVLEINPTLIFPVLEMLLGGSGKTSSTSRLSRELTEIEQSIVEVVFRIILHDLRESWRQVTNVSFSIESHETEPSLLQFMAPNEAVVAISLEIRVGEIAGMMNIGIPSIIIKMLRQKFDQGWSGRRSEVTEADQRRVLQLIKPSLIQIDARLQGPTLKVEDLLAIEEGDVLMFDYSTEKPLNLLVNSRLKFHGQVVAQGKKKSFLIRSMSTPSE
jgi:flagellar motor switch protein FliM